jgi:hypothetical protein
LRWAPTGRWADDAAVLPDSVEIVFPVEVSGVSSGTIAYNVPLTSLALPDFSGVTGFVGTKCFHSSAVAVGTGTPSNNAELQALADQIATDFYRYACGRLDLRLVGYPAWTLTGLEDHAEYQHQGDCGLRIVRGPWLDHLEEMGFWSTGGSGTIIIVPGPDPECWTAYDAALDVDQNNYGPSPLNWWRLTRGASPANVDITGIIAGGDGCPILITHERPDGRRFGTANTITLKGVEHSQRGQQRFPPGRGMSSSAMAKASSSATTPCWPGIAWSSYPAATLTQAGIVSLARPDTGSRARSI